MQGPVHLCAPVCGLASGRAVGSFFALGAIIAGGGAANKFQGWRRERAG